MRNRVLLGSFALALAVAALAACSGSEPPSTTKMEASALSTGRLEIELVPDSTAAGEDLLARVERPDQPGSSGR